MLVLTNEDVEQVLTMDVCLQAVEDCTREIALGNVIPCLSRTVNQPLPGASPGPTGPESTSASYMLRLMPVIDLPDNAVVLRVNSTTMHVVEMYGAKRHVIGRPGSKMAGHHRSEKPGWLLLFDLSTGYLLAMVQDRHVQTMRVGAVGGLGAKYMARSDAHTIGLLGVGWMAGPQLLAHCAVRRISSVRVFSPNPQHRQIFSKQMSERLGIEVRPAPSAEEAVRRADIVISATNSIDPTFDPDWVGPGSHVYCVTPGEYDERMIRKADVIAWAYPGQSEHSHGAPTNVADPAKVPGDQRYRTHIWGLLEKHTGKRVYLTDLVTGRAKGRTDDGQITFNPSPAGGTAGIARFAVLVPRLYELAKTKCVGHDLPDDWFRQEAELY
ncbi:MAG: ornithine cyclodeaminase family protein [Deltaproteobacteria bacterium]|nr:ornithine cyclodeaminase family protein [Deltaproteobacteria bacterium]